MSALPLFDRYAVQDVCAKKHRGAPESEDAYERTRTHAERDKLRILDHVGGCGRFGATVWEISQALTMPYTTASARCAELKHETDGRLVKTERRRPTSSGSMAAVVVARAFA